MSIVTRTHCAKGHDLAVVGVRVYQRRDGRRDVRCIECHRQQSRTTMARSRARNRGRLIYPQSPGELSRFFAQVTKGHCWSWTGADNGGGYGVVTVRGVSVLAHRASYMITHGEIPEGMELDHLCRNTRCVNPEHLEPVTHAENVRRGEANKHRGSELCARGHFEWVRYKSGMQCRRCSIERKRSARHATT